MSSVQIKIVRSDGAVFGDWNLAENEESAGWNVGCGAAWTIPNDGIGGAADLEYEVTTSQNVLTDGSSLISKRVGETERTLKLVCNSRDADSERSRAISFFNPRYSFELHVSYRGKKRFCKGEQTGFQAEAGNVYAAPTITWTLLCLDPWWKNENGHEEAFGDARPMFGFPFVSHVRKQRSDGKRLPPGFLCGKLVYDGENSIYNTGDVPCMYRIVCRFEGDVSNPDFIKNDQHVKLIDQYVSGDVLEIDFEASPPTVEKNGVNCIQKCTRDSNFVDMEMAVGTNVFNYTCDDPDQHRAYMKVQLLYNDNFLGI